MDASQCGLEALHETFIRPKTRMNLSNNNIKELPRDEMLDYLNDGGQLDFEEGGMNLSSNPLI